MKKIIYFIFFLCFLNYPAFSNGYTNISKVEEIKTKDSHKLVIYLDKVPEYELTRDSQTATIYLNDSLVPTKNIQNNYFSINQTNENQVSVGTTLGKHKPLNIYADKNPMRLIIETKNIFNENTYQWLSNGMEWENILKADEAGSLNINQVSISKNSNVKLEVISVNNSNSGRMKLSEIVKGDNILTAINGGFFGPNGEAIGYLKIKNVSFGFPFRNRAILGIKGKECYMARVPLKGKVRVKGKFELNISGINRKRNSGEVIIYDSTYGKNTNTPTDKTGSDFVVLDNKIIEVYRGNAIIPSLGFVISVDGKRGEDLAEKISIKEDKVELVVDMIPQMKAVEYAVTGGPLLIDKNNIVLDLSKEGFGNSYDTAAPRTAIGLAKDKIWLVTIDGRQMRSRGLTLKELSNYLLNLGCYNAMNLDGGGSTAMIIKDRLVNYPSDGTERTINNGIIVMPLKK